MEIELKRGAWYCKLQQMMFGKEPTFDNFCPFFWLTVFCIIALPFWGAYQLIRFLVMGVLGRILEKTVLPLFLGFVWCLEKLFDLLDKNICRPIEQKTIAHYDDAKIVQMYQNSRYIYIDLYSYEEDYAKMRMISDCNSRAELRFKKRQAAKFAIWKDMVGSEWRKELTVIQERYQEKQEKLKELQTLRALEDSKKKDSRKETMLKIVEWTRILTPYLLGGAVIILGWVGIKYGIILWLLLVPVHILMGLVGFGMWVAHCLFSVAGEFSLREGGLFMVIPLLGALMIKLSRKCDLELPNTGIGDAISAGLRSFFRTIGRGFKAIGEFFSFIWQGILMFKKDHCPHIKWKS